MKRMGASNLLLGNIEYTNVYRFIFSLGLVGLLV